MLLVAHLRDTKFDGASITACLYITHVDRMCQSHQTHAFAEEILQRRSALYRTELQSTGPALVEALIAFVNGKMVM